MIKKKSISKNYLYNLLYQIIVITIPIILIPFIAETLTPDGEGIFSFTQSIVIYFGLISWIGINLYGTKMIAKAGSDEKERREIFWHLVILKAISTSISIIGLIALSFFLDHQWIVLIQGIYLIGYLIDITWFFQGTEDFKMVVIRNTMIRVTSLVLILLFVRTPDDVWKYALIAASCEALGQAVVWFEAKKYNLFKKDFKFTKTSFIMHFKESFLIFVPQTILSLYSNISISFIGFIVSEREVSYYSLNLKIVNALLVLVTALGTVIIPRVSRLIQEKDERQIKDLLNKSIKLITYISIPMTIGIIMIANLFIPMFLGEQYIESVLVLVILSLKIIFTSYAYTISISYIVPSNQYKIFIKSVIVGLVVNVVLCLIFIHSLGAIGGAIATVGAEVAVFFCYIYFTRKQVPFMKYILSSYKVFIAGAVMTLSLLLINQFQKPLIELFSSIISQPRFIYAFVILCQVSIGIITYVVTSFIVKNEIQIMLMDKIFRNLKLKK